jgi:putative transcriptional regulator
MTLAKRITQGLKEARDHARGAPVRGLAVHVPKSIDVQAIRTKTGLSQVDFAKAIGVSPGTLRNWEQKRRIPDGPARVLLALVKKDHKIVRHLLAA